MRNSLKYICFIVLLLLASHGAVQAQSVTLHEGDLDKLLKANAIKVDDLWIVNGNRHFYQAAKKSDEMVPLGKLSGILWNIAAMRLIDKGAFTPDHPIALMIDDFELDSPFREILTVRHLLAGTGGFATPPWHTSMRGYSTDRKQMKADNDWRDHLVPVSNPGLVGRDDPVGQALLAKAISNFWEQSYQKTLYDLVFAPLGVGMDEIVISGLTKSYDDFFNPVLDIRLSQKAFVKLLAILSANRIDEGDTFLSLVNYTALMKGDGWRVHPLGPGRSYGFSSGSLSGRRTAKAMPAKVQYEMADGFATGFIAFPDAGVVIVKASRATEAADMSEELLKIASLIAEEFMPQTSWYQERKASEGAEEVRTREGYFMLDDAASAWLGEKLFRAKHHSPYIWVSPKEVKVSHNGEEKIYQPVEPRVYRAGDGEMLYVSDLSGGYIAIGDALYRYTGAMGNPNLLISPIIICLIIIFTAAIHWKSKRGKDWQRFARWSTAGAIFFAAGLYCELEFYPTLWVEEQSFLLIVLWRSLFNIGLMLILTIPMYTWRFGKQNSFHKNVNQMVVGSHVIIISASALILVLLAVAWGLAGELAP